MPETQDMLLALQINPDGCHQAVYAKKLAVNHQRQQIFGNWTLHELFQLFGSSRFPVPADAGSFDAIALQASFDSSLIVPSRALPRHLSSHRLLHLTVLLKGPVAVQGHFLSLL